MPKRLIKRITPNREAIHNHRYLQFFGHLLHDPNLWHINRRSSAGAFAVGLFIAFVPIPSQMFLAAGAAILFRVNLPLSITLVWVTNPLTIPPMFFSAYLLGAWLTGAQADMLHFEFTLAWLRDGGLNGIWMPFLLGCMVCGIVSGLLGYFVIRGLWRLHAIRKWEERRLTRSARRRTTIE